MSNLNMSIGSTIKSRREVLNIKQDDLAEQVGVTVQTMSKWERDLTEPKASQVYKLSKALKITERDICKGESTKKDGMDPLEFVRRVSILMQEVPQTELLVGMHDFIDDEEGFIKMLSKVSDYPYELFDSEGSSQNELMFQFYEQGDITFRTPDEEQKFLKLYNAWKTKQ